MDDPVAMRLRVRNQQSRQQKAKPIEINLCCLFLTMLIDLNAFNKSNSVILLDFRWEEGLGSGLVPTSHLGSHALSMASWSSFCTQQGHPRQQRCLLGHPSHRQDGEPKLAPLRD